MTVQGLLLAAGAGSRMGRPKALVVDPDGTAWLARGIGTLLAGGCDGVTVVLGAEHERARQLIPPGPVSVAVAEDWADGMSASLRTGLTALADNDADIAVVTLVDLPDVGPDACRRVLEAAHGPATLARAAYAGRPGHPVLLGRDHWAGVLADGQGDRGARDYLARHDVDTIECGDLATGRDVDTPPT